MRDPDQAPGADNQRRLTLARSVWAAAEEEAHAPATAAPGAAPKRKKAAKVRSAWISFVGRVVAQVTGAVATVVLGVLVLHRYSVLDRQQGSANQAAAVAATVVRPAGQTTFAVLPFQNLTGDPGQEFLADGLTETLTADLARVDGLHVVSRTSAMRFKDERRTVTEIARQLGADLVVEGSISKAGSRVRVTAQLIDARADDHLWARHYDLTERDPLTMQAEVAAAIAADLRAAAARKAGTEPVGITRSGSLR
jgi:TolB-like protein